MSIHFTQYLLPNGRKRDIKLVRDGATETLAHQLIDSGLFFEAEMLQTGEISLTANAVDDKREQIEIAHEIIPNGPEVPLAVDRLVKNAASMVDGLEISDE